MKLKLVAPPSWQMGIGEPEPLVVGLFVRDIAGLRSRHTWLPHCAPAVPRANGEGSAEAAHQWDLWWDRSVSAPCGIGQSLDELKVIRQEECDAAWWTPPGFESLRWAPELQEVVARHFDEAEQWGRDRKQERMALWMGPGRRPFQRRPKGRGLLETDLVADLEREAGRKAQPFRLAVTEIPVAGCELWQLDAHHVLVTAEMLSNADEYRRLMTPVIQALL